MPPRKNSAVKDQYPQFMRMFVTQSAANTLTFAKVGLSTPLFEYAGLLLSRIEYYFFASGQDLMTTSQDDIDLAVTGSDTISDLGVERPEVYDKIRLQRFDAGAAANNVVSFQYMPEVHEFTGFPSGGILVPLQDIYLGIDSSGLASATSGAVRLYYQTIELKAEDYIELAQRLRVLST